MDIDDIVRNLINSNERTAQFSYYLGKREYLVEINMPTDTISIPYILAVPTDIEEDYKIVLEANNLEDSNEENLLKSGLGTCRSLANVLRDKNSPIIVPIIPSVDGKVPYYQQLSRETFEMESSYKDLDKQILQIISEAKDKIFDYKKVGGQEKIFLNGYSSSGVFAQRFSLIHPEIIDTACIGGASASIPVPIESFSYPIGIKDYEVLFGKKFDLDEYQKIKFRYYVGEFEEERKTDERLKEDGSPAPMHDMSYMERSIPTETGRNLRRAFGDRIIERAENITTYLESMKINITHTTIAGRSHNNKCGLGVNELGDKFIEEAYEESSQRQKKL